MSDNLKTVFMFTGQGSQYYHMGRSLYQENTVFRKTLEHLDDLVKSNAGYSVLSAIYDQNKVISDNLDTLAVTHPAIFMIQHAMVQTLKSLSIYPDIVLGYSLGEYCALTTAESITPDEALTLILHQAKIVSAFCEYGFMYAILSDRERDLPSELNISQLELVSKNFQQHFVVAGPHSSESTLINRLNSLNMHYFRLPIHYGFHSSAIEPAIEPISAILDTTVFHSPKIPVASSTICNFIDSVDSSHFYKVIRTSLHFQETLEFLENQGQYQYIDIGPTDTLTTFAKYYIKPHSKSKVISTMSLSKERYNTSALKSDLIKLLQQ